MHLVDRPSENASDRDWPAAVEHRWFPRRLISALRTGQDNLAVLEWFTSEPEMSARSSLCQNTHFVFKPPTPLHPTILANVANSLEEFGSFMLNH